MNWIRRIEFLTFDLPIYLLAAVASFVIGTSLLHWSMGVFLSVVVVLFMRALTPMFRKLLQKGEQA